MTQLFLSKGGFMIWTQMVINLKTELNTNCRGVLSLYYCISPRHISFNRLLRKKCVFVTFTACSNISRFKKQTMMTYLFQASINGIAYVWCLWYFVFSVQEDFVQWDFQEKTKTLKIFFMCQGSPSLSCFGAWYSSIKEIITMDEGKK